jgi:hypothetical protein
LRRVAAEVAAVIRVDAVWLAVAPIDMRAGIDTALARVVAVFGCAQAHHQAIGFGKCLKACRHVRRITYSRFRN